MQSIIHGGKRHLDAGSADFPVQLLRSNMPMTPPKQKLRQGLALPGGTHLRVMEKGYGINFC